MVSTILRLFALVVTIAFMTTGSVVHGEETGSLRSKKTPSGSLRRPKQRAVQYEWPTGNNVNCGGHTAEGCYLCPFDQNFQYQSGDWCHGECVWDQINQCRDRWEGDVNCGFYKEAWGENREGFFRPSCAECISPDSTSEPFCGGDCHMVGNQCVSK